MSMVIEGFIFYLQYLSVIVGGLLTDLILEWLDVLTDNV